MIIQILISMFIIIISIIIWSGKGAFLMAEYNTMFKEEKEKIDERKLCRFFGTIFFLIGLTVAMSSIDGMERVSNTMTVALLGFALIFSNTGNRFKK